MATPLLETKLFVPRLRRDLVPRPRLAVRLDRLGASKLVLVSAPPGFGKSTLLAEWLAADPSTRGNQWSAGWLSLDRGDNDPVSFWTYLIAALQRVAPGVGEEALALLQERQPPPMQTVLTTLLNDLSALDGDLVLVLDDYHVVDATEVHEEMAFLLDNAPAQLHLVLASRSDPPLPLARLRARGELVEIRVADLRFTPDEAAAYLNETMGLQLRAQDVTALEGRTEGWIAALQLAALSLQGRDDVTGFVAGFTGDDRYVVDYLVEEVVQRQSEDVQAFLLQTSILDRLSGPLCEAVTGQADGKTMLERLERSNLFLIPLDDRRHWYRYHHLFADVLQARLLAEMPDLVPGLHQRASEWLERNGEQGAAIRHALAAEDFERAAGLIELAMPALRRGRQETTLRGWLELLPDEAVDVRPVLAIGYVGALLSTGETEGVEPLLQIGERWLEAAGHPERVPGAAATGMVVVDDEEWRRLPGWVANYRAGQALLLGDASTTVTHARRAQGLVLGDDHLGHGAAAALLGLASWGEGDLETAHAAYTDCSASMQRAGHGSDVLACAITLADIRIVQGRLGEAMRTYERALQQTSEPGGPVLRGTADMYVGMSAIHCERNDLDEARRLLLRSQELGEHIGLPKNPYRWRVAMARIREAEGDMTGALALLDEAERLYDGDFSPNVRPVPAMKARALLVHGRVEDALDWAREHSVRVENDLSYLHEFEHVTLARALLAQHERDKDGHSLDQATGLLERLREEAEAGGRTGSAIEIVVLQALAHQLRGDVPAAVGSLARAVALAEPEGYVRIFVDEGPAMTRLLEAAADRGITPDYARRLTAASTAADGERTTAEALIEPLSRREREVLRLLATELDGPEIASELVVSVNTVRTHTKNIYAKFSVNNRRAAVRRARELGITS